MRTLVIIIAAACLALPQIAIGQVLDIGTVATYAGPYPGGIENTVSGTVDIVGALDVSNGLTVDNGASIVSGTGGIHDNGLNVGADSASIGGEFSSIRVLGSTSAITPNGIRLISDNDASSANARSVLIMDPTSSYLLVQNAAGASRGLSIIGSETRLSGGTDSTTLVLNDAGATFVNDPTGGPALVHGVANGVAPFDAVNVSQLNATRTNLSSGIASVAALAAIPPPIYCKNYSVGFGYGHYGGENAGAVGFRANIPKSNVSLGVGAGFSGNSSPAYDIGAGYSF